MSTSKISKRVGERIAFLRIKVGLTQQAMADLVTSASGYAMGRSTLANIEAGRQECSLTQLFAISTVLNVPVPELLAVDQPLPYRPTVRVRQLWVLSCGECGQLGTFSSAGAAGKERIAHLEDEHDIYQSGPLAEDG